ncbi:D,D-heptose 1,7-bisphosphate phosphatase [Larkinella arboricola]|uniref:D,D-heptose 1,7-bisphosphate phosphatase n=1 Tax=Larkinella arboricola TaxID=643671 RepID=A0A327X3M3_LARAB|nr:HAD family hydrolase [Larkinella arboricola]RAK00279.1 D,D-heptose 1,7-bisphosphate phosphatase [Larkinella arboricola]
MKRTVFIDKDGTLIYDVPFNVDPKAITLYPDAGRALHLLQQAGFRLLVVSNQSGVAQGYFQENALEAVTNRLQHLLRPFGVHLDGFYYCPHHPDGRVPAYAVSCSCRKPQPGMLQQAAREHGIDLTASWMIRDILNDVEAGNRAGCRTILLDNGHETEWQSGPYREPTHTVSTWTEAVEFFENPTVKGLTLTL